MGCAASKSTIPAFVSSDVARTQKQITTTEYADPTQETETCVSIGSVGNTAVNTAKADAADTEKSANEVQSKLIQSHDVTLASPKSAEVVETRQVDSGDHADQDVKPEQVIDAGLWRKGLLQ